MILLPGIHVFLILMIANLRAQCNAFSFQGRGFCATGAPDDSLMAEHKRLSALESQHDTTADESRETVDPIEIETWFHIVSGKADAGLVSDEMITAQLSRFQKAYENATISYRLKGVTRQINDTWARNGDDLAMKNALRRGGYSTLNVYFQTDLQASPGVKTRSIYDIHNGLAHALNQSPASVLGFCTLPDPKINSSSPRASYVNDGCNVLAKTMPGGPLGHYNRGGTAVHEIGHWNGLLHCFEGGSCSSDNAGDYIADTPQQSMPTNGCPSGADSCPDRPGLDAIHNFMDYSSDDCYESFTPGQVKRMRQMWSSMRLGK